MHTIVALQLVPQSMPFSGDVLFEESMLYPFQSSQGCGVLLIRLTALQRLTPAATTGHRGALAAQACTRLDWQLAM